MHNITRVCIIQHVHMGSTMMTPTAEQSQRVWSCGVIAGATDFESALKLV